VWHGFIVPSTNRIGISDSAAWSPDGKQIAFQREADIYVMNSDGSKQTRLTDYYVKLAGILLLAAWAFIMAFLMWRKSARRHTDRPESAPLGPAQQATGPR
jgi:hypothetical protein